MPGNLQKPVPKPRNHQRIADEFLAKTPDELAKDPIIEDNIEELLSYNFLAKYDYTSLSKIYFQIGEVEKMLGNTVNSDRLFRITMADNSRDFSKQWAALFNREYKEKGINDMITEFILQKNSFLGKKIREFYKDIEGFCLSFTNAIDLLKLGGKEDLDYLLNLVDYGEDELSNKNFDKFLNGKLYLELLYEQNEEKRKEKQKLIDAFSLVRYLVEEAAVLQASNINIKRNSQFSLQYTKDLPTTDHCLDYHHTTRSFDPKKAQIVLNRSKTKQVLQDLPEGHAIDLKTNGHSVSITKVYNNNSEVDNKEYYYIVVDSNGSCPVFLSTLRNNNGVIIKLAEDRLCDVVEIITNYYLIHCSTQMEYHPHIYYSNATKTNAEVEKCLKEKDGNGKPYYKNESLGFSFYKYEQELKSARPAITPRKSIITKKPESDISEIVAENFQQHHYR